MATGTGVNQGKTAFVEGFLTIDPDAALDAVNRAWKSAGNEGSVSESLVSKTRSQLRLTGKRGANGGANGANAGPAAKGKAKSSSKGAKGKGASKAVEAPTQPEGSGARPGAEEVGLRRGGARAGAEGQRGGDQPGLGGGGARGEDQRLDGLQGQAGPGPDRRPSPGARRPPVHRARGVGGRNRRRPREEAPQQSTGPETPIAPARGVSDCLRGPGPGGGRGGGGDRRPDVHPEGQRRHAGGRGGLACGPEAADPKHRGVRRRSGGCGPVAADSNDGHGGGRCP